MVNSTLALLLDTVRFVTIRTGAIVYFVSKVSDGYKAVVYNTASVRWTTTSAGRHTLVMDNFFCIRPDPVEALKQAQVIGTEWFATLTN